MSSNNCSLPVEQQAYLLHLAKDSILHTLRTGTPLKVNLTGLAPDLTEKRATFVTLQKQGQLRGCIGMLAAVRPLAEDIARNAHAAAFEDPRFPPVSAHEVDELEIHLSLLTPAEPMRFESEQDLLRQIRPGVDGLILSEGTRRGTFLPSVWEQLPEPLEFLRHLKRKAGLPMDYWSDTVQVDRYRTEMIG
jgi:AmmeMemoRadiSam system protein A